MGGDSSKTQNGAISQRLSALRDAVVIRELMDQRCNVLSEDKRFLFFGKVTSFNSADRTMRVENFYHNELPNAFYEGTPIKLQVAANKTHNMFITVEGKVILSAQTYLVVAPVNVLKSVEARQYFRQSVMEPSRISLVNKKPVDHPCTVIDLSGNGIGIQSKSNYEVGSRLSFVKQKFFPSGAAHQIECTVVRKKDLEGGQHFYGCQFVIVDPEQEEKLFHDVFLLQARERSHRR